MYESGVKLKNKGRASNVPDEETNQIQSMTGYARAEGHHETDHGTYRWTWDIRSLNGKGLDIKCRFPSWLENLEAEVRDRIKKSLSRGTISASLQIRSDASETRVSLNHEALEQVLSAVNVVSDTITCAPPTADGLLSLKGVLSLEEIEDSSEGRKSLIKDLLESFDSVLVSLLVARQKEGAQIATVLTSHNQTISQLTSDAEKTAEVVPEAIKNRLETQLNDLLNENLPEDRLAHEVAILAVKADVREEIDRLKSHIKSAAELIAEGKGIGRRFEFLIQEFNREANTLCSKAQTIELKRVGLDMKAVVDQLREQVLNIE